MAYWLLKTEPDVYSWDDLVKDGKTVWDGVTNNTALMHIRTVKKGDRALIYHTGGVRSAIGLGKIVSGPYPDPKQDSPKLVVFDLAPEKPLPKPVTLEMVKQRPELAGSDLVRLGRLSVVPLKEPQWRAMLELAGLEG